MADSVMVRVLGGLPAVVVGPSTRWFVALEYYDKGGKRAELIAKCLTNGRSVVLERGRARSVEHALKSGFLVRLGSIEWKIMDRLVAQGLAQWVETYREDWS